MNESSVAIQLAIGQISFDSDNGNCNFRSIPRNVLTDLIKYSTLVALEIK